MATALTLTAHFTPVEHGWVQGQLLEFPGVLTAAPTQPQAEALLADALREYLLADAVKPAALPPHALCLPLTISIGS